ncbi:ATP-binding protein [Cellulomonas sp. KRMCY2]|uniref:sensor histidine kinase n=1 Tax=Cellulomonas sp. KRMCY2 TaxID=1304865 RepID=UPI00045E77F2|nr:ATP-binding protein [Cellulomonas sp. KRMCY2]
MADVEVSTSSPERPALTHLASGLSRARRSTGLAIAIVGVPAMTVLLTIVGDDLGLGSILLLYLLADVVVAAVGGLWPSALAVVGSLFAANWFFTPPFHTLAVESRDSVVELVVFAVVALIVSLTVELAARVRARAGRLELEADLLSRFARQPASQVSLMQVLEHVRTTFGMTSAALVQHPAAPGGGTVLARVGDADEVPTALRIAAGPELELVAQGPSLFAEDRRVLERLAAAAARAWESQALTAQATELAETDRVRSALLAAVGHDLRTPLAGIKAAVSGLRQDDVSWSETEHDQLLATIEDSADRLTDLVANLLDMSRLQAGGITAQPVPVAIDEVVSRALLDAPGELVHMDIPDDLPLVCADPGLLERVVANLVDNARRHSTSDRPVAVTARLVGPQVVLAVADHGSGVPQDTWPTMFEPFQRLGDRSRGSGTGLGLAIVKGFCEAMDVDVAPSHTPGGGLTMTLTIQVAP